MRTGTIIFILVIAWSVLNAIISHLSAKKKQEQEAERLRARRAAAQSGGKPGERTVGAAELQAGRSPRTKMDDLIARRKAQIEELRAQREARRGRGGAEARVGEGGQAIPQLRDVGTFQAPAPIPTQTGRRSAQGRSPAQSAPGRTVPARPPGAPTGQPDLIRARQEAQGRIRDAQQQRQRAEQARKAQEQQATRLRERADAREADRIADAILVGTPYETARGGSTAARVRRRLGDVRSLRELFLLKEVLDRPVSMRE